MGAHSLADARRNEPTLSAGFLSAGMKHNALPP